VRCLLLRPIAWLAGALVRLPQGLLLALSSFLATLLWLPLARRRQVAATNLALCFPDMPADERARLLRANLRSMVMGVFELLRAWFAPARVLRAVTASKGSKPCSKRSRKGRACCCCWAISRTPSWRCDCWAKRWGGA